MAYHYVESGLDNVHLENGFHLLETSHGIAVSIEDVHGLHAAIGRGLIDAPAPLTGAGLRFLRIEMDLSQRALADLLGTTEQTLRRYEKARGHTVPGPVDHLIRALYAEYVGGDGSVRRMAERLAGLEPRPQADLRLRETAGGWALAA